MAYRQMDEMRKNEAYLLKDLKAFEHVPASQFLIYYPSRQWWYRPLRQLPLANNFIEHTYDPIFHKRYWGKYSHRPEREILFQHYNDLIY